MTDQPTPTAPDAPAGLHPLEVQRRLNRDKTIELGLDPYGSREEGLTPLADAASRYDPAADEAHQASDAARREARKADPDAGEGELPALVDDRPRVKVAGRVVLHRDGGKLVWMNLRDAGCESFQVAVSKADCEEAGFALAKATDLGDIVVAEGPLMRTKKGEITLWASSLRPGAKCLVPPPEKRAGLSDVEARYRQRYVDLWASPETMGVFRARSAMVAAARRLLDERGFVEVETPMLQAQAGGAAARPFTTHMNALDIGLFMRVAPELYLKRLLVGGMPRVYEINRNFRNEGLSPRHNPEFTMLELYEAFGDYTTMMSLTEELLRGLARVATEHAPDAAGGAGGLTIAWGAHEIDWSLPFERVAYESLFERGVGCAMTDEAGVLAAAQAAGIETAGRDGASKDHWLLVGELFEAKAEPLIDACRPTFVLDYPAALCPLTRSKAGRPEIAERFELYAGGLEIANAYTELNDPDVQEAKFRAQLAGIEQEESTFRTFDEDFVRALKVGMPPAGGLGVGIDRVVMLLTGQTSIRDVILFPMLRPLPAGGVGGASGDGAADGGEPQDAV